MSKIPTAEEFIQQFAKDFKTKYEGNGGTVANLMIEFAKLHVKAVLEAASEKADTCEKAVSRGHETVVDKDSILNAYPLSNIK